MTVNNEQIVCGNSKAYSEEYRPRYHYSPEFNWCNDPNGMVCFNGEWHLFYQYSESGKLPNGKKSWGHAVSKDLLHWRELAPAISTDIYGEIYSGSAVIDEYNTSGFFSGTAEKQGITAVYTVNRPSGVQEQCVAYSLDNGRTFTKYNNGAPIITAADDPLRNRDFRDPKIFWIENSREWIMAVAGGPLRIYSSKDLKNWKFESSYAAQKNSDGKDGFSVYTECPDLFPLNVAETGEKKWVLNLCGRYYIVGDFYKLDGSWLFKPETEALLMNFGKDSYAAQTYYGTDRNCTPDGRRIMINWMNTWEYSAGTAEITDPYSGFFTLQSELTLHKTENGLRLYQNPIAEYKLLRDNESKIRFFGLISAGSENPFKNFSGISYEIVAEILLLRKNTKAHFFVRTGINQQTVISYNFDSAEITVDRSESGKNPGGGFADKSRAAVSADRRGYLKLRIFVDSSSIEIYSGLGDTVGSFQIFPDSKSNGLNFTVSGGEAEADITVYPMKDIRNQPAYTEL